MARKSKKTEEEVPAVEEPKEAEHPFADAAQTYTVGSMDDDDFVTFCFLSTGVPAVDLILKGGYPCGVFCQVYGEDRSGKTLMSLRAAREALLMDPESWVLYIDSEHSITRELCILNDFEPDQLKRLYVVHTAVLEDTLRWMKTALTGDYSDFPEGARPPVKALVEQLKRPPALIVWDSVATAITSNDYEADPGKQVGYSGVAKVMPRRLPAIAAYAFHAKVPILLTNQARESLDIFDKEMKFSGGKHLRHTHFTRLLLDRYLDKKTNISTHKVQVSKSKLVGDGIQTEFVFAPETGFDYIDAIVNGVALPLGIVTKAGAYYQWRGQSFYLKDTLTKLGAQIKDLVADVRAASGIPLLGGRSLDRFIEKRLASLKENEEGGDSEFADDAGESAE